MASKRAGGSSFQPDVKRKRESDEFEEFYVPKFENQLPAKLEIDKSTWARPKVDKQLGVTSNIACQVLEVETYHVDGSATSYERTNVKLKQLQPYTAPVKKQVNDHYKSCQD
uniref:Uncharacterized protein n=1 Tax=Caenorhabditis japonica TaxID=281687 RepID=A0A8R1EU35_CAEJA